MAPSRSLRNVLEVGLLILFKAVAQDLFVPEEFNAAQQERSLAVSSTVTLPPRPNTLPDCEDPVSGKAGYEPVCPPGYFKCCATCKGARCFSNKGLHLSWRGIRECIRCAPGDFCLGCDTFTRCRLSEIPGREGPKITPPGSTRPQDCETCPSGFQADLERKTCIKKFKHVCNEQFVRRCTRNCKSADILKGKDMDYCERMQCQMYCAKQWSTECAEALSAECIYRKAGPSEFDILVEGEEWLTDCDIDCNSALSVLRLSPLALLLWLLASTIP